MKQRNGVTLSIGLAIGATAGAALAYLFAPQSGDKTEAKLRLESKKLQYKALLKADDFVNDLNYRIDREVSKEEARRLNDMRARLANGGTQPEVEVEYVSDPVIEIDQENIEY